MTDPRQYITAAIDADCRQDTLLAAYAEHGRASDLVTSIELAGQILGALIREAERIGRPELATIVSPHF